MKQKCFYMWSLLAFCLLTISCGGDDDNDDVIPDNSSTKNEDTTEETVDPNIYFEAPKNVVAEFDYRPEFDILMYRPEYNNIIGEVHLSWDADKYAQGYNVYRNSSSSGTFEKVAENVSSTTWTDNSPLKGFNYYKVSSVCNRKEKFMSYAVWAKFPNLSGFAFKVYNIKLNIYGEFNMVKVRHGTFMMGSTSGDSDEKPVHSVTLSDYYIGDTEVTQGLWKAVMGSNPSKNPHPKDFGYSNRWPVQNVSWDDCQRFVNSLNNLLSDQLPSGRKFRLPTEAEWEFAARGGTKSRDFIYSGFDDIDYVAWYSSTNASHIGPPDVATMDPNELGIYDMSGNEWEWCQDWYGLYNSSAQTNPIGPRSGSYRVIRGGDRSSDAWDCRVSNRDKNDPTVSYIGTSSVRKYGIGLRLAL